MSLSEPLRSWSKGEECVIKEQTFKSPRNHPLIVSFLLPLRIPLSDKTKGELVCYRLSAGSFVCVGLNERGKRHSALLTLPHAWWQPIRQLGSNCSFTNRGSVGGVRIWPPFGSCGWVTSEKPGLARRWHREALTHCATQCEYFRAW